MQRFLFALGRQVGTGFAVSKAFSGLWLSVAAQVALFPHHHHIIHTVGFPRVFGDMGWVGCIAFTGGFGCHFAISMLLIPPF